MTRQAPTSPGPPDRHSSGGRQPVRVSRTLGVLLAALVAVFACGGPPSQPTTKPASKAPSGPLPAGVGGLLTYQRDGNVYALPIETKAERKLTDFPLTSPAVFSARSPDGSRLAYVRVEGMGSALWVANGDGGDPRKVVDESANSATIERPRWIPDGSGIIFTYHGFLIEGGSVKGEVFRAERIDPDGGNRTVLAQDAEGPSMAPDGSLTFVRTTRAGQQLVVLQPDGTEKVLVADRVFLNVAAPRFSRDGKRIAFTAVGEGPKVGGRAPATPADTDPSSPGRRLGEAAVDQVAAVASPLRRGTAVLVPGPAVAHAHGEPWDIWLADVGGSVRLLSKLTEDEPTTAWGEGDRYLAVSGGTGVYIIDVANGQATQLVPTGGFGGIDWTR